MSNIKYFKLRYHRLMVKFWLSMAKNAERDFTTYWKYLNRAEEHYQSYWRIEES